MSFIPVKKVACVLSLLMMSSYTFTARAADATPVVTANAAEVAPAAPAPVTSDAATPEPVAPENSVVATPDSATSDKAAVAAPEPATPDNAAVATSETVTPDKAVVATPEPVAPEKSAEAATLPVAHATSDPAAAEPAKVALSLNSEEQKRAYASGIALAQYIEEQIAQQKALHITLDKNILLAGITDAFNHQEKMSVQDVQATLMAFDEQVKILKQAAEVKKQEADKAFINEFTKRPDVKKTSKGLYYLIEEKGEGAAIKDTNQVEVSYIGELIDGTVVDGPQIENSNQIFRVANMPPVLRDSVKLIRKGGRIKLVIPPAVLESNNAEAKKNSGVMIYTISVVNVKNP